MTVETLHTLVHIVIVVLWAAFLTALIFGVVRLARHRSAHRARGRGVIRTYRARHGAPARSSLAVAVLASVRELAAAHALLRGETDAA